MHKLLTTISLKAKVHEQLRIPRHRLHPQVFTSEHPILSQLLLPENDNPLNEPLPNEQGITK